VALRPPNVDDIEDLARLHISTWRETYSALVPASFFSERVLDARRRQWESQVTAPNPGEIIRVATVEGAIVGFAMAGSAVTQPAPRDRELYMLYLAQASHGSGAGQQLLDAVLGEEPAFFWMAKENPRARAFYERNGFRADWSERIDESAPLLVEVRMVR
jgi:ribosomal protein S18 acetylase RimI-like enzyme